MKRPAAQQAPAAKAVARQMAKLRAALRAEIARQNRGARKRVVRPLDTLGAHHEGRCDG